jgi:hypothetical protein
MAAMRGGGGEALQNAQKHGGEEVQASIRLESDAGSLLLTVSDTGRGFQSSQSNRGAGLRNMSDRLGAVRGSLSVSSVVGRGTTVSAVRTRSRASIFVHPAFKSKAPICSGPTQHLHTLITFEESPRSQYESRMNGGARVQTYSDRPIWRRRCRMEMSRV